MNPPSRVLVLGASGMLGSVVVAELAAQEFAVLAAARTPLPGPPRSTPVTIPDLTVAGALEGILEALSPDAVVNCAGLVKQRPACDDPVAAIATNALLPHRLAAACHKRGMRLVHVSTDCVFSGAPGSRRGALGYRETDPPDATDLYGRSKLLGEVSAPGCLTLRMSLIGREPSGSRSGLVEWFLAAAEPVRGYAAALFTGVTTPVAARLIALTLLQQPMPEGIWHAAAAPISKLDLLRALAERVRPGLVIEPMAEPVIDRRLDGTAMSQRLGWSAPPWPAMLDEMLGSPPCAP